MEYSLEISRMLELGPEVVETKRVWIKSWRAVCYKNRLDLEAILGAREEF